MDHQKRGAYAKQVATDGVLVGLIGKAFQGRQQIEQAVKDAMKRVGGIKSFEAAVDEVHALPVSTFQTATNCTLEC